MRLIYGTGNPAKLSSMQEILRPLHFEIVGIKALGLTLPFVDESGNDPLANAVIKAKAYYKVVGKPLFSCDSGLFIEGLSSEQQPGVHVRTVDGRSLSDEEMIDHYTALARSIGGPCYARYRNGICLVLDSNHILRYTGDDICGERFILSDRPHPKRMTGFPLDSLSIQIQSGQYYYDRTDEVVSSTAAGFLHFFRKARDTISKLGSIE